MTEVFHILIHSALFWLYSIALVISGAFVGFLFGQFDPNIIRED